MALDLEAVSKGFSDGTKKPRPATKSQIAQIKNLIDTTSMQVIARKIHIPHKEVKRIVTELKLI